MKKFLEEFKTFISRGNVLDMAVGVIIGNAFGKIVSSLVDDVFMPVVGVIIGGHDFSKLAITIGKAQIKYGSFIQNIVDFLIVAFCIFIVIKFINNLEKKLEKRKKQQEEQTPAPKAEDIVLLEEIRDLLKKQNSKELTK